MNINAKCLNYVLNRLPALDDVKGDVYKAELPDGLPPFHSWTSSNNPNLEEPIQPTLLTFRKIKQYEGAKTWYEWELCV